MAPAARLTLPHHRPTETRSINALTLKRMGWLLSAGPFSCRWLAERLQSFVQCVNRQLCSVGGSLWEPSQTFDNLFPLDRPRFSQRAPLYQFHQLRSAGDGRNATLGLEARFGDTTTRDAHRHPHDVAAGRIANLYQRVGLGDVARIARVLKVVQDLG